MLGFNLVMLQHVRGGKTILLLAFAFNVLIAAVYTLPEVSLILLIADGNY